MIVTFISLNLFFSRGCSLVRKCFGREKRPFCARVCNVYEKLTLYMCPYMKRIHMLPETRLDFCRWNLMHVSYTYVCIWNSICCACNVANAYVCANIYTGVDVCVMRGMYTPFSAALGSQNPDKKNMPNKSNSEAVPAGSLFVSCQLFDRRKSLIYCG